MRGMKKPKKRNGWNAGDICFWIEITEYSRFAIKWGRVDEVFHDGLAVDVLEPKENRIIRDLIRKVEAPIDEWKDEKYHKLPKGWTYNTAMYEIDRIPFEGDVSFNLEDVNTIKSLFDRGLFVRASDKFQGKVECEVTKEGYRIIKTYPMWERHKVINVWLRSYEAYHSLKEARRVQADREHEFLRQCNLTDEEWSFEQIEKNIYRYARLEGIGKDHSKVVGLLDYFRNLDKIDEVETRLFNHGIQWKREKQRKWRNVVL